VTRVLGIDTSAYTTSAAVIEGGRVVTETRRLLPVRHGERGLRPQDAVMRHLEQMPEVLAQAWDGSRLDAVAVSTRPRPLDDSYLPPFQVGVSHARGIASTHSLPLIRTSHQEGHIAAGILDAGGPPGSIFHAIHISGGTTELLRVVRTGSGFAIRQIGATADLYAGQLVDRVGVRLGLGFPAGPELEALAREEKDRVILPVGAAFEQEGLWRVSFSGPEAAAMRAIEMGAAKGAVARGVEEVIARALAKLVDAAVEQPGPLLVVGGVAANRRIRADLRSRLEPGFTLYWASPERSRDNAVGVALIGYWAATSA
jgi:N6-L-threonylcarbamoyladenine synthase